MGASRGSVVFFVLALVLSPGPDGSASGEDASDQRGGERGRAGATASDPASAPDGGGAPLRGDDRFKFKVATGWTLWLDPTDDFYPRYLADPRNPSCGLGFVRVLESDVLGFGNKAYDLAIGARFPVARLSESDDLEHGFQFDVELAYFGRFDQTANSLDNLAYDGWYALNVVYVPAGPLRYRIRVRHDSAHVGDEYISSTARERIGYTRDDIVLGAAWTALPNLTVYAEGGWAVNVDSDLQDLPACAGGLQYDKPRVFLEGRVGYYAAVDVQLAKERSWQPSTTVQVGLQFPLSTRRWRTGVQFYRGRVTYGEFFMDDETTIIAGIWLDI